MRDTLASFVLLAASLVGLILVPVFHFRTRRNGRSQTYKETALLLGLELVCLFVLAYTLVIKLDAA